MKLSAVIYILFFFIIIAVSCKKQVMTIENSDAGTFVFYRTNAPTNVWNVFINDINYGIVPHVGNVPHCNTNTWLKVELEADIYSIQFKDKNDMVWGDTKKVTLMADEWKIYVMQ